MRVAYGVTVAAVAGSLVAGCGGASNSGTGRLNNPVTLASAVQDSVRNKLAAGTAGLPPGTALTGVSCVNTRRLDYTCTVRFTTGPDRTIQVAVQPGGRSYVVTAGDL